jgi:hypothetical protein
VLKGPLWLAGWSAGCIKNFEVLLLIRRGAQLNEIIFSHFWCKKSMTLDAEQIFKKIRDNPGKKQADGQPM